MKSTVGSAPPPTVTALVADAALPSASATVSVTDSAPTRENAWLVVFPVPLDPSPKSHEYETTAPSGSEVSEPSRTTFCPWPGADGVTVKSGIKRADGRMTPSGTSRRVAEAVCAVPKSLPLVVASIVIILIDDEVTGEAGGAV